MIDRLQIDKEKAFSNDEVLRYDELHLQQCRIGKRVAWGFHRGEITNISHGMVEVLWDGETAPDWCYPRFLSFGLTDSFTCKRCGHGWIPNSTTKPKVCPKCKSPYWDTTRKSEVS